MPATIAMELPAGEARRVASLPRSLVIERTTQNSVATTAGMRLAILRLALAGVLMMLLRVTLPVAAVPAQSALITAIYASAALFAVLMFRPRPGTTTTDILRWCLAVSILFTLILIADPVTRLPMILLCRVSISLFLLTATIAIATRRMSLPIAATLVALLTLLPVWAAPAVEWAGNPTGFTNWVVATSPLTAFAVALDLDYLRSSWFYANSALGSMRYAYPGWFTSCFLLSLLPVAALLAERLRSLANPFTRFAKEANP